MNRQAIQAALGRAAPAAQCVRAQSRSKTSGAIPAAAASFSTTTARPEDRPLNSGHQRSAAAAQKLAQLSRRLLENSARGQAGAGGSQPSTGPSPSSGSSSSGRPAPPSRAGGIDARSLRVTPGPFQSGIAPPKVINLRSLRRVPVGGRLGQGLGRGRPGVGGPFGARLGAGPGGAPRGGRLGAAAGRQAGRGRGPVGGRRRARRDADKDDGPGSAAGQGKLTFTPEEQAIIDRLDKGEVVRFDPKLTLDSLSGYGAAVATDAPIGQVETAIRAMRVMTGGMAFNSDSGVTADITDIMKRYNQKKPFFVHSKGEKEWIETAKPKFQVVEPKAETKKAIIDAAIRGKYEAPTFTDLSDVKNMVANYHSRTFTYRASDSQRFLDKVLSLLPAQGAAGGQAPTQPKKSA